MVAAASVAAATPSATVVNNCDHDVYLWAVSDTQGPMVTLGQGKSWTQEYQINPNGGGSSIKIAPQADAAGSITQFEYTYTPGSIFGGIFYDISNINGQPFGDVLTELVPQLNGATNTTSCSTVQCPKNQAMCEGAYNWWNDDQATHSCPDGTSLTFNVCSPQQQQSASAASSSSSSSSSDNSHQQAPASTPAPAPAPAATTPAPAPAPAVPSPVKQQPQTTVVTAVAVATQTQVVNVSPNAYALQWSEGAKVITEGKISKREDHANHMERHARIARMHHARSVA